MRAREGSTDILALELTSAVPFNEGGLARSTITDEQELPSGNVLLGLYDRIHHLRMLGRTKEPGHGQGDAAKVGNDGSKASAREA